MYKSHMYNMQLHCDLRSSMRLSCDFKSCTHCPYAKSRQYAYPQIVYSVNVYISAIDTRNIEVPNVLYWGVRVPRDTWTSKKRTYTLCSMLPRDIRYGPSRIG